MGRALLVILAGTLLLAGAVAVLAPASALAPYLERVTGGRFAAHEVDGTVWRGRGVLVAGNSRLALAWKLDPIPLLTGRLSVQVAPIDGVGTAPRAEVVLGRQHLVLRDVDAVLPAGIVARALAGDSPLRAAWRADGEVSVTTSRFEWTPPTNFGALRLVWRNARITVAAMTPVDLGELTAALVANGELLAGPVANQGGDLDVRGDVALNTDGSTAISLLLTPRRSDAPNLGRALGMIGKPEGDGWRVQWRSSRR